MNRSSTIVLTIQMLSTEYDTVAEEQQVDDLLDSLDEEGVNWMLAASDEEVAAWATGVLCNTLPTRDEDWS